jgi:hypothetical protein
LYGIEAMLDQKDLRPGENIDDFMTRGINKRQSNPPDLTENTP